MVRLTRVSACCAIWASLAGCGAAATGDEAPAPSQDEIDAQVTVVQQALGEASCATTPPDYVFDPTMENYTQSPTDVYGHPTCQNGFVVELPGAKAGKQLYGQSWLTTWEPFTCALTYGYVALYKKQGTSYVSVGENFNLGTWGIQRFGPMCSMAGVITVPVDGDYKVVVSAGNLFGGLYGVRFLYF